MKQYGEDNINFAACQYLPVGIHDRALAVAYYIVVPSPRLGVDGFAYRAEHTKRRSIVLLNRRILSTYLARE